MDILRENAKAVAGAVATIVVLLLKPFVPAVADPTFQPALEIVVSMVVIAAAVWCVPNQPKGDQQAQPPTGFDDRRPQPPIAALLLAGALLPALLGACATQPASPPEAFSRACSTVGEAMVQVNQLRRQGKVNDATFVAIDDAYDAAVSSCDTLPVGDTATAVAMEKVTAFLAAAGGVTGNAYQY